MEKEKEPIKIAVNTFNWGPCVVRMQILDDFRKVLLDEARNTELDFQKRLAGQIAKERGYNEKQREKIIPYLSLQAVDDDANITVSKPTPKAKPVLSAERFQDGLDKVNADKITKEQFVELCGKYELNDTQKKSIELLKKI